ncbi:MAG: hypothetical protein ACO2PN_27775 [Pyrobaculum sp.]|jgi:hypothetical protein
MSGVSAGRGKLDNTPALVPADWQATEMFFKYPIAVKVRSGRIEIVKPIRRELSQSGLSGTWYFAFGDVDVLIYLRQRCYSIGRHRWVEMTWCGLTAELCDKITDTASETWKIGGGNVEDVVRVLKSMRLEMLPTTEI